MNTTTNTMTAEEAFSITLECLDRFAKENNEKANTSSTDWLKGLYAGKADAFMLAAYWIRNDLKRINMHIS